MRNSITWDLFVEIALTHENVPSDRPIKKGRRRRGRGRGGSNNGTAYDVRSSTFIAYLCKTLSWKLASSIYSDANGLISKALKRGWNICFQPGLRNTRGSRALIKKLNGNARTLLRKFTFFFFFFCVHVVNSKLMINTIYLNKKFVWSMHLLFHRFIINSINSLSLSWILGFFVEEKDSILDSTLLIFFIWKFDRFFFLKWAANEER